MGNPLTRACGFCNAFFNKETDELSLSAIKEHKKECKKEEPYVDDNINADGYLDLRY